MGLHCYTPLHHCHTLLASHYPPKKIEFSRNIATSYYNSCKSVYPTFFGGAHYIRLWLLQRHLPCNTIPSCRLSRRNASANAGAIPSPCAFHEQFTHVIMIGITCNSTAQPVLLAQDTFPTLLPTWDNGQLGFLTPGWTRTRTLWKLHIKPGYSCGLGTQLTQIQN